MDDYNYDYEQADTQKPVVKNAFEEAGNTGKDGKAVSSLVLGIISLVFCWSCGMTIITSVIGLILGIISLVKAKSNMGIAIAGVVTSGIGLVLGVLSFIIMILFV